MSERKLYTTGNGNTTTKARDTAYWDKLRNEFQRGQHLHSGAYCASAHPRKTRSLLDED